MKLTTERLRAIAAEWRAARRIYPVYLAIASRFALEMSPCAELDTPIDRAEDAALDAVRSWLQMAEQIITAHHLRVYCQTSASPNEAVLRALLTRHLGKPIRTEADRDKVDFLLVQYVAQCAPMRMQRDDVHLAEIAHVLEPVLGGVDPEPPSWLAELERAIERLRRFESLSDLLNSGLLQEIRATKANPGEMFFDGPALLSFARYNLIARRAFFRLMRADVDAVSGALQQLRAYGMTAIDCSRAQLSASESVETIHAICAGWKQPFRAEYCSGASFEQLAKLKGVVQSAVQTAREEALNRPSLPLDDVEFCPVSPEVPATQAVEDNQTAAEARVENVRRELAQQLSSADSKENVAVRVVVREQRHTLSSWEVRAFADGASGEFALAMQMGVAVRVLLEREVEDAKERQETVPPDIVKFAQAQAAQLQEQVAQARDARDIDAAVTLAATSKRLAQLIGAASGLSQKGAGQ